MLQFIKLNILDLPKATHKFTTTIIVLYLCILSHKMRQLFVTLASSNVLLSEILAKQVIYTYHPNRSRAIGINNKYEFLRNNILKYTLILPHFFLIPQKLLIKHFHLLSERLRIIRILMYFTVCE